MRTFQIFKRCYECLEKKKVVLVILIIIKVFLMIVSLGIAFCFSNILTCLSKGILSDVKRYLLGLVFLYIMNLALGAVNFFMQQDLEKNTRTYMKRKIIEKMFDSYICNYRIGTIVNSAKATEILYTDANNITTLLFVVLDVTLDFVSIVTTGIILLYNNFILTLILSTVYILLAFWTNKCSQILEGDNIRLRNERDEHFKLTRDILKNVKYICLSNSRSYHYDKYSRNLEYVKNLTIQRDKKAWGFGYVSTVLGYAWNILLLGYSAGQLLLNKLILADFLLFLSYSRIYTSSIASLAHKFLSLQTLLVSADRVFCLLDTYMNQADGEVTEFPKQLNLIEISDLSFSYGDKDVILNLNRKISERMILITGKNGHGKTTLLNLLAGLILPDKGKVCYNGIPSENISFDSFFGAVVYACQGDIVFDMTIKENILSFDGSEEISEKELIDICREIGVLDDIMSLKEQFDTPISELRDFSYGQKKKILLARSFLRPSQVILFDEPLDGLDSQSQKLFVELVRKLSGQKFIFIATHKPEGFAIAKEVIAL